MSRSRSGMDAFEVAEEKGRQAARAGKERTTCPYRDHRTYYGAVTFSRGFRRAWFRGFDAELTALAVVRPRVAEVGRA